MSKHYIVESYDEPKVYYTDNMGDDCFGFGYVQPSYEIELSDDDNEDWEDYK